MRKSLFYFHKLLDFHKGLKACVSFSQIKFSSYALSMSNVLTHLQTICVIQSQQRVSMVIGVRESDLQGL